MSGVGRSVWGFAVVRGISMQPSLRPGDRLLIRYGGPPRVGRLVVVRLPDRPIAVKRAASKVTGGWDVRSDNPAGTDSRTLGPVPDADVLAVVLCRVWPPGRRRSTTATSR
jgi:phage repressor protein C with HTH and peptisase S24 domain